MLATNRPLIIVDIDNTILNNDKRKQAILKEKLGRRIGLSEYGGSITLPGFSQTRRRRRSFGANFSAVTTCLLTCPCSQPRPYCPISPDSSTSHTLQGDTTIQRTMIQ